MHEFHSFYYDRLKMEPVSDDFTVPSGTVLDGEAIRSLVDEHRRCHLPRLEYLGHAYETRYEVFGRGPKPDYKPDNRLAADMAYDITETFEGYFIGIPVDVTHPEAGKSEYLRRWSRMNSQEDVDAELSKAASKYGIAYEMLYQDDEGRPRSAPVSPLTSFMVHDDSVLHRKVAFVRYAFDEEGRMRGTFSDAENVYPFSEDGDKVTVGDPVPHYFRGVPAVAYPQNSERRGLYEGVLNLIEAYNRVLSEKANDVEYFSDAYMVVKGTELPDDFKEDLREYKLINLWGDGEEPIEVMFLQKPDGDATQENLINRLEDLIFKMAMVPDITDEGFSTASGTALKMRMMPMNNLARNKERKFKAGVMERLRLLANYPEAGFSGADWEECEVVMHRNMPEDLASEAAVAGSLSGIVSEQTQLSVLSCVDDPAAEISRKEAERDRRAAVSTGGLPIERAPVEEGDGE